MTYKLEIRSLAVIEILEAYDWYELQKEGLGNEFFQELEKFYTTLQRNPDTYSYYEKPVRPGKTLPKKEPDDFRMGEGGICSSRFEIVSIH